MNNKTTTGNSGEKIRSDCEIVLEIRKKGGIDISLHSKVKALYGQHISKLVHDILGFYGISHASLLINDSGALDFVIAARLEAAIRRLTNSRKEYLLPFNDEIDFPSSRERFRFSRLYLPGNTPSMMLNAGIHNPHGIILDLEDSVSPLKKYEARILVRNALRTVNFYGAERMVRINQIPAGLEDLSCIIPHKVHVVLLPKCEDASQVILLEEEIKKIKQANRVEGDIFLMPIIESALGVENSFEIAKASKNIIALAIGLEDYTADLGVLRTLSANESFYARTRLVNACRAAGIQAIDSVFSDVGDYDGLKNTVEISKSLGFEGMGCIHPRQIPVIHAAFTPDQEETDKAAKIVHAFNEAEAKGMGVVALGTKMIDPPVVKRAIKTLELAERMGITNKKCGNENENR